MEDSNDKWVLTTTASWILKGFGIVVTSIVFLFLTFESKDVASATHTQIRNRLDKLESINSKVEENNQILRHLKEQFE